ncbi:ectoine/hydroxyectoine ABC transporter permease subunit EhuC [Streptomyces sp. SS7]|uniref:ectoine/hydroxyectoine ABC transporter permease subunit EhuC n=1 Tax=Streptomyces sp. SS7 TaxID=3108485 RepID=UPI0030EB71C5
MRDFYATFLRSLPDVTSGLWTTVEVTALGACLAAALAFTLGFMTGARHVALRGPARLVIEFFRGTSLLVQLFWLYYALPILGITLEPLACAVVALGLNYGAYGAEVVRGATAAVPVGQREAALALSMSPFQRMRLVILPQAWPQMIPPFNNLLIQLLKCTPLVSLIAVADITFQIEQLRSTTGETAMAYLTLLVIYFLLAYVVTLLMRALEASAKARIGQSTPWRRLWRPGIPRTTVPIRSGRRGGEA